MAEYPSRISLIPIRSWNRICWCIKIRLQSSVASHFKGRVGLTECQGWCESWLRVLVARLGRDQQAAVQKNKRCHSLNRAPLVVVIADHCAPRYYRVLATNAIYLQDLMFGDLPKIQIPLNRSLPRLEGGAHPWWSRNCVSCENYHGNRTIFAAGQSSGRLRYLASVVIQAFPVPV